MDPYSSPYIISTNIIAPILFTIPSAPPNQRWVVSKKLGVPFFGGLIRRIVVFWGLYWGPPTLENYQISAVLKDQGTFLGFLAVSRACGILGF